MQDESANIDFNELRMNAQAEFDTKRSELIEVVEEIERRLRKDRLDKIFSNMSSQDIELVQQLISERGPNE